MLIYKQLLLTERQIAPNKEIYFRINYGSKN